MDVFHGATPPFGMFLNIFYQGVAPFLCSIFSFSCYIRQGEEVIEAIQQLERRNLAKFKNKNLTLTEQGEKVADVIYNYHKIVEEVLGHNVAHALEHLGEFAEKIKKLSGDAKPLEKFRESEKGVVAYFEVRNPKLISRLLGAGLSPGVPFQIIKSRKDGFAVETNGRIIVLGKELGKSIVGVSRVEGASRRTT